MEAAEDIETPALRIDGEVVTLREALRWGKWRGTLGFLDDARDAYLIRKEAAARGLEIDADELQRAANDWRQKNGLEQAQATRLWLTAHALSVEEWQECLEQEALEARLRAAIATPEAVDLYFARHRLRYDRAVISRIVVSDPDVARELRAQAVEDGVDFHWLARRCSEEEETRPAGGYVGPIERDTLPAAVEAAVWGASAGTVVGPIEAERRYYLVLVEEIRPAALDDEVRAGIADRLFDEWLERARRRAVFAAPLLAGDGEG